ncbi:hypothetical protein [Sulfurospirillum diekertiae]|uniref:hypothetical protein n=1 Tax=Sulfurospirillum diekertiae TaxID=1854492 RepID=UPI0014279848|nr:hypothetical protein [Sulfurospirillum diekertiae]
MFLMIFVPIGMGIFGVIKDKYHQEELANERIQKEQAIKKQKIDILEKSLKHLLKCKPYLNTNSLNTFNIILDY